MFHYPVVLSVFKSQLAFDCSTSPQVTSHLSAFVLPDIPVSLRYLTGLIDDLYLLVEGSEAAPGGLCVFPLHERVIF